MDPSDLQRRIELTTAVRDTDRLPKVGGAGQVADGVQTMHNGVRIEEDCYYGAFMTEIIRRLRGHHEPQEEVVFHELVERLADQPEPPVMVELGAFWAYYSLWLHRRRPDARLVLVEPDPQHIEVGRRNFALNEAEGTWVHAAVGSAHGTTMPLRHETDQRVHPTPVVSLDGLMADHGLDRIDLLLVDVQGAEREVVQADALAAGRVRFLVLSTHHFDTCGDPLMHQKCLAQLRKLGAHIIVEHTIAESCSGDGLIACSFDPRDRDLTIEITRVRASGSLYGDPAYEIDRLQRRLRRYETATGVRLVKRGVRALLERRAGA